MLYVSSRRITVATETNIRSLSSVCAGVSLQQLGWDDPLLQYQISIQSCLPAEEDNEMHQLHF